MPTSKKDRKPKSSLPPLEEPYYSVDMLAAELGLPNWKLKYRLRTGELAFDAVVLRRPCFTRKAARAFARAELKRGDRRRRGAK